MLCLFGGRLCVCSQNSSTYPQCNLTTNSSVSVSGVLCFSQLMSPQAEKSRQQRSCFPNTLSKLSGLTLFCLQSHTSFFKLFCFQVLHCEGFVISICPSIFFRLSYQDCREAGAYLSCNRVRDRVHLKHVAIP